MDRNISRFDQNLHTHTHTHTHTHHINKMKMFYDYIREIKNGFFLLGTVNQQ